MKSPASRFRALLALLIFSVGISLLAGCYTTLRHPGADYLPSESGYQDKGCYDCHDEAAFYHSYYGVYFDYYYGSPWFGYYSDPWWYDSYWGPYSGGDVAPDYRDTNARHRGMRGFPSGAPRGSGGSSATAPYLREDYQGGSSKSSEPPAQADKPKEKQEQSSDKKRNRGGRGKKK